MARINLLPWRDNLRRQRKREFGVLTLVAVLLTVGGLAYWHWFNTELIDHQRDRNKVLKSEIAKVDKQIKEIKNLERTRSRLIARMRVIQDLQSSRPQVVHLFDEIVTTLPDGVHLTELKQSGNNVALTGMAESNARVSAFMRKIEDSPWLAAPRLRIIEHKGPRRTDRNEFKLNAKQVVPKGGKK